MRRNNHKKLGFIRKYILLFLISLIAYGCYSIKYSSYQKMKQFPAVEKYRDVEAFLDYFKDSKIGGIYTDEESGIKEISYTQNPSEHPSVSMDFIQISDVQIRNERAQLYGRFMSGILDAFVHSVRFNKIQEIYDYAVFMCLILGLEESVSRMKDDKPSFLIHTGDSVHVSLVSELWEFLYIMGECFHSIPWFNVIGNHDITIFGNSSLGRNSRWENPTMATMPINVPEKGQWYAPDNYITFHKAGGAVMDGIPFHGPLIHSM